MAFEAGDITPELIDMISLVERAYEREVDDKYLEELRAFAANPIKGMSGGAQKYAERGAHQLSSSLDTYNKAEDKKLWRDYLDASYAELFLGVTPLSTEPVESCYLNEEHTLYAKQFFQVKELMDSCGFAIPDDFKEPADHIAMEVLFFLFLLKGKPKTALQFKEDHMDKWFEEACKFIVDTDDIGFYSGIANLTRAFMAEIR